MKRLTATLCLTIAVLLGNAGVGYALPPYPLNQNRYYDNCYGTYTWADGSKYVGEFLDGKAHGHGTKTWASGDKYVGEYRNGERNGQGTFTWADGGKYVGEFKDGNSYGKGIQYHADGTVEKEGIWKDDFAFQQAS